MKIVHICLANFYIDNYSYQENILPKMHKLQGLDVMIIASTETFIDNNTLGYLKPSSYYNENGIPVVRLPYVDFIPHWIARKIRLYIGLTRMLESFNPQIIFLHDVQFLSIKEIVEFVKKHRHVKVYADGHADFSNSASSFISKHILHKVVYKYCVDIISPFVTFFYGTLPARVDFFMDVYKTPPSKTKLLVMGADDDLVRNAKDLNLRSVLRAKYSILDEEFVIITGGKIDQSKKQVLELMKALNNITDKKIRLIIFGSVAEELMEKFEALFNPRFMINVGWVASDTIYGYFEASDLVVFPGRHSVLWEQAVGQGKPCVFRYYPGHNHIDLGGNCNFLYKSTSDEMEKVIKESIASIDNLKINAEKKGINYFSYYQIAKRSIELNMETSEI